MAHKPLKIKDLRRGWHLSRQHLSRHRGTLLLDEIGEMPVQLQAKLLRVLQDREIHPLGEKPVTVDVRIVAATNADLAAEIKAGRFRRDLYYRLAGSVVAVPTLRERREDLLRLVEHFLRLAFQRTGRRVTGVTIKAMRTLAGNPWPGNVRELEHEIRRVVHLCDDGQPIDQALLSEPLAELTPSEPVAAVEVERVDAEAGADLNLEALERRTVAEALRRSAGNKAQAARWLGISRTALGRKIQRHGLEPES
ncbi:MAG: sigma-54-dependent Fis family transcriptional regulator [bacterium]|nr:sigma-54-dependent Fis family transcriptional regulator [bacterium]